MKLEKLYKDILEANVGDKLFADPDVAYSFRNDSGFDRDFVKWVEKVYGPDYEPNTTEETQMLYALGKYFGDVTYAKDLGKYVEDLKALKAKFPRMLDPKNTKAYNREFPGYAMRGAKIPMDQYEKLIRKSEEYSNRYTGTMGLVKNPGITYKSRGQYGFTSFTTDFAQAAKFARSFKEKDFVGVVYGVKLDDPNLVLNPSFANAVSDYKENETLYVGNTIEPDFIVIVDPRMESNFLYDIKAYEIENDLEEYSIKKADFYPQWAKTHTPRLQDFTVDGMPTLDKDKKPRLDSPQQAKIAKLKAMQAKKLAKNESISLYEVYTDLLISEVGEGTSKPFSFSKISKGDRHFQYKIDGEVRTEDGEFVLQSIPILLTGRGTSIIMDEDYTDKEILDFFGKNDGTSIKGFEIVFSRKTLTGNEFGTVDDRVFMFRLMATIKKILQAEFAKADPEYIVYAPTKQGDEAADQTGRHRLYSAFIKKAIPGAQMFHNKKDDEIIYKLK